MIPNLFVLDFTITSTLFILLLIPLTLILKLINKTYRRDPRLVKLAETIPGPPETSIFGSYADFFYGEDLLKKLTKYFDKYGHTYKLWFGKHLVVGLSKIEDIDTVFMSSKMLGKPEMFHPFHDYWGDGLFTSPLDIWKNNRKKLVPAYTSNRFEQYTIHINEKIRNVTKIMEKKNVNGPEFNIRDYTPYLSFDIVTKLMFNLEFEWNDAIAKEFHLATMTAMQISYERMCLPWFHMKFISDLFYKKKTTEMYKSVRKLTNLVLKKKMNQINNEIRLHKESSAKLPVEEKSPKLFLTTAYELLNDGCAESVVHDEIVVTISGGTDTTATVLSFFFLLVAIHREVQMKLYDELYAVFGDSDRDADQEDIRRLSYLDQVIKETLRRFPLAPFILREVQEDSKIGDRIFPAGTVIMVSIAGVHMNPEFYPNPWEFNPENFSPERVESRPKHAFIPFSAGVRNCIGQNLALMEMKLITSAFLRKFSFHTTMKMDDIKLNRSFTINCINGYNVSIKNRIRKPSYLVK